MQPSRIELRREGITISNATRDQAPALYRFINKRASEGAVVPVSAGTLLGWIDNNESLIATNRIGHIIGHTATYVFQPEMSGAEIRAQVVREDTRSKGIYWALTIGGLAHIKQMSDASGSNLAVFVHKGPNSGGMGLIAEGLDFKDITSMLFKPHPDGSALSCEPRIFIDALPERMRADALRRGPDWHILIKRAARLDKDVLAQMLRTEGWDIARL